MVRWNLSASLSRKIPISKVLSLEDMLWIVSNHHLSLATNGAAPIFPSAFTGAKLERFPPQPGPFSCWVKVDDFMPKNWYHCVTVQPLDNLWADLAWFRNIQNPENTYPHLEARSGVIIIYVAMAQNMLKIVGPTESGRINTKSMTAYFWSIAMSLVGSISFQWHAFVCFCHIYIYRYAYLCMILYIYTHMLLCGSVSHGKSSHCNSISELFVSKWVTSETAEARPQTIWWFNPWNPPRQFNFRNSHKPTRQLNSLVLSANHHDV